MPTSLYSRRVLQDHFLLGESNAVLSMTFDSYACRMHQLSQACSATCSPSMPGVASTGVYVFACIWSSRTSTPGLAMASMKLIVARMAHGNSINIVPQLHIGTLQLCRRLVLPGTPLRYSASANVSALELLPASPDAGLHVPLSHRTCKESSFRHTSGICRYQLVSCPLPTFPLSGLFCPLFGHM